MTPDPAEPKKRKPPLVRRRSEKELRDLARDVVTNRKMVTDDPDALRCAFYVVLPFVPISKRQAAIIGALIGDYNEVVPGRAMNGWPIFTSVGFLHKKDAERFNQIVDQVQEALR